MRQLLIEQKKRTIKENKKPLWKQVCLGICISVFLLAVSGLLFPKGIKKNNSMEDYALKENQEINQNQKNTREEAAKRAVEENTKAVKKTSWKLPYYLAEQIMKGQLPLADYTSLDMGKSNGFFYYFKKAVVSVFPSAVYAKEKLTVERNQKKEEIEKTGGDSYEDYGEVARILGETYFEDFDKKQVPEEEFIPVVSEETLREQNKTLIEQLKETKSTNFLIKNFYIVDSTTMVDSNTFQVPLFLSKDFTMKKEKEPQILIYHTHGASEGFSDSQKGEIEDSIIGVGEVLASILKESYGYEVIHDTNAYDLIDGTVDRNKGYNMALDALEKTLEEHPSIEVMIDLHRDSGSTKRVTMIHGKPTAQMMLFNGLSRNLKGPISYLENKNLQGNLAFSLQLKLAAMEKYPDFTKKIYLKGYRYNLHLREKSLLIELGTVKNTVEEAKNAMEPLADILNDVLQPKNQ